MPVFLARTRIIIHESDMGDMRNTPPIFGNKRDLKLWKQTLQGSVNLQKCIEEILSKDEPVHSAVLIEAIKYLDKTWDKAEKRANKMIGKGQEAPRSNRDLIKDLVLRSRLCDCMAAVTAAEVMCARSDVQSAYEVLSVAGRTGEVLNTSLLLAEVRNLEGDPRGAREAALRAYDIDPSVNRVYDILTEVDPTDDWYARRAINAVYSKAIPMTIPTSGDLLPLYDIYHEWFNVDRGRATDMLVESQGYKSGDKDYILASARMSADEHDWNSAMKLYLSMLNDSSPVYLKCEVAEALLMGGKPAKALEILRSCNSNNIRVLKDIVRARASNGIGLREAVDTMVESEFADSDELIEMVRVLISAKRIDEADRVLEMYLEEQPHDGCFLAMLSEIRLLQGKVKNAMTLAKRAMRDRKCLPARIQMARMMLVTGNIKAAQKRCDRIIADNIDNHDALALKRDIQFEQGEYKSALDTCKRILRYEPGDTQTLIVMSCAYSALGETEGSTEVFNKALHADLNWDNSRAVLESLIRNGMNVEATDICYELDKDFPNEPMLRRLRGNAEYSQGLYREAIASYKEALYLDVNNPVVWHSKGMAEEMLGEYDAAEDSYNRAVILNLSEPEFWISKASIQEVKNDIYGAVESLNRAIELDPRSVYALVRKATLFDAAGRTKEAAYFMEMALTTAPDDKDLLKATVRMYLNSDMSVKALPYAKHLHELSTSAEAADLYIRCLIINGDTKTSMDILSMSLNNDPDNMLLLRCKFECMMYMKEYTDARHTVDRIASINPDYVDLDAMYARIDDSMKQSTAGLKGNTETMQTDRDLLGEYMPETVAEDEDVPGTDTDPMVSDVTEEDVPEGESPVDDGTPVTEDAPADEEDASDEDDVPAHDEEGSEEDAPADEEETEEVLPEEGEPVVTDETPIVGEESEEEEDDEGSVVTMEVDDAAEEEEVSVEEDEVEEDVPDAPRTLTIEITDEEPIIFNREQETSVQDEGLQIVPVDIEPVDSAPDVTALMDDARSLFDKGAMDAAIPLLEEIVILDANNAGAHSMLGRAYCNIGDISAAVPRLDTAIFLDTDDYEAYSFRASIHESMEETDDAILCYKKAISHGCDDVDVQRSLAYLLSSSEDYSGALRIMSRVVDDGSVNVSDVVLYGDLARFCGDHAAVTKAVNRFLQLDAGIEETVAFARIVEEAGHPDDAKRILSSDDEPVKMSPSLKKSAEKAMRYAFSTGMSPFDPDLYENCGLSINESEAIMEYLGDIPDYGEIDESSPDFELMELRSMDIIIRCGLTDLEDGVLQIERIFTKGGFKDLDDAKNLYSYIRTAISSHADSDDPSLINMAMQVPADAKLFDIIDQFGVGIYSAVAIKTMATR